MGTLKFEGPSLEPFRRPLTLTPKTHEAQALKPQTIKGTPYGTSLEEALNGMRKACSKPSP